MPDMPHIELLQERSNQEAHAAYKRSAVQHALLVLDPTYTGVQHDYLTLVARLREVLDAERDALTTPSQG